MGEVPMTSTTQLAMSDLAMSSIAFQNAYAVLNALPLGDLLYFNDSSTNCVEIKRENRYLSSLWRYSYQDFSEDQFNKFINHLICYWTFDKSLGFARL